MDSGIAALVGALVGGSATFAASFFQSTALMRHQRVQAAKELAIKEHEFDLLLRAKKNKSFPIAYLLTTLHITMLFLQ